MPQRMKVPLFPLPNVVLFPRAVLPLHIFEQRYKAMTADALISGRLIAMALLRPGWEKDYYCRPAIEPVVCVGKILTSEKLSDGKYNFLLQGTRRARVIRESSQRPYRIAEVELMAAPPVMEIDLLNERQRLSDILNRDAVAQTQLGCQLRRILASPLSTSDVVDLIAFNLLQNVPLKQALLAEADPSRRISRLIAALEEALPAIETVSAERGDRTVMN